ncbi:MAG: HEAT repeat domain-containing protein [Clostridia bacterium]|nr:HEAT repeat domain-containing protein [Clostridia bacterium]
MGNERHIAKIQALGEKRKVPALAKYCKNKDAELRAAACRALAPIQQDEAYNELVLLTRDPELSVRMAAVTALGDMGRKSGADHVRHVMSVDSNPELIKACQTAVAKIVNSDSKR